MVLWCIVYCASAAGPAQASGQCAALTPPVTKPFNQQVRPDTWFYTKRYLLLALADNLSKHMMLFSDDFFYEIMQFLDAVEEAGTNIKTVVNLAPGADPEILNRTVASQARYFKQFFLKLRQ